MINVWVTGSEGQLGRKIKNNANLTGINFLFTTKEKVDLTIKYQIKSFIKINKINLIINLNLILDLVHLLRFQNFFCSKNLLYMILLLPQILCRIHEQNPLE